MVHGVGGVEVRRRQVVVAGRRRAPSGGGCCVIALRSVSAMLTYWFSCRRSSTAYTLPVPISYGRSLSNPSSRAHVVVERRLVGTVERRSGRVVLGLLADGVEVAAGEAAVEPADRLPLVAQQLLGEALDLDAQVAALHVVRRQAGVARQPGGDLVPLRRRQPVALQQRLRVVVARRTPRPRRGSRGGPSAAPARSFLWYQAVAA